LKCRHCGASISHRPTDATLDYSQEKKVQRSLCPDCGAGVYTLDDQETIAGNESLPVQVQIPERFKVEGILGQGSFGVVSRCWDETLQRHVAVKVSRDAYSRNSMFLREARAASRLQHENIVRVFDVGEYQEQVFIVSEWVDGQTLRNWLDSTPHTQEDVIRILISISHGINYAHQAGIVHRDLKPGNILVDKNSRPRILDFGLSRSMHSEEDTLMVQGQQVGTPAFMAPEQVRGDVDAIDHRTDIYALGVVLFQLLTKQLPYSGSVRDVMSAISETSEPPSLRGRNRSIPAPLDAICRKAMAKVADDRYASASDFANDLQAYLDGTTIKAYSKLHGRRVKSVVRRNWTIASTLVLAPLSLFSLYYIYHTYQLANPLPQVIIASEPPGAKLQWTRFDPETGFLQSAESVQTVAGETVRMRPGFYQVVAQFDPESIEVFRLIPASPELAGAFQVEVGGEAVVIPHRNSTANRSSIELPTIKMVPIQSTKSTSVFFPPGKMRIEGEGPIPVRFNGQTENVTGFLLGQREVTWGDIQKTWPSVTIPEGRSLTDSATGLDWDLAVTWCELNGCNLPSVFELAWAATNGGTTRYVSGDTVPPVASPPVDTTSEGVGPVEASAVQTGLIQSWDATLSQPPVAGLLTGASEWTCDPFCVLRYDDAVNLVPVPAQLNPLASAPAAFPSAAYVVMNIAGRIAQVPTVPANLGNLPIRNQFPNLGFRTVRRLHVSSVP
jgi:eukaryotic-like serine/threonine-protein kinase